jgi:hypothetical protein
MFLRPDCWRRHEGTKDSAQWIRAGVRTALAGDDLTLAVDFDGWVVARDGIEPPTHGFSVRCSTS